MFAIFFRKLSFLLQQVPEEPEGPWSEPDVRKRQALFLNSGLNSDFTVHLKGGKQVKCHSTLLAFSSAKLAAMILETPHELQLEDVEYEVFRTILE
jgi:hypothetical protein